MIRRTFNKYNKRVRIRGLNDFRLCINIYGQKTESNSPEDGNLSGFRLDGSSATGTNRPKLGLGGLTGGGGRRLAEGGGGRRFPGTCSSSTGAGLYTVKLIFIRPWLYIIWVSRIEHWKKVLLILHTFTVRSGLHVL